MAELYDSRFYDWVNLTARRSAEVVLPFARDMISPRSVVDVGCGEGVWLSVWSELGVRDLLGLDGDYVRRERLLVAPDQFVAADLRAPVRVGRRFDLAQSLEVGEHLPEAAAEGFVDGLCALSDIVLFSAAVPGQGGEMHVNEKPPSWWARKFAARGYAAFDPLRPLLADKAEIAPWYRYNSLVFANAAGEARLSAEAKAARCALLAPLPEPVVTKLSRLRYRVACAIGRAA